MEPSNELSFDFSDPTFNPSSLLPAPCPSMDELTADPNWLSDAELDKLIQSCTVPEGSADNSVVGSWDVDQLLSLNLSLGV